MTRPLALLATAALLAHSLAAQTVTVVPLGDGAEGDAPLDVAIAPDGSVTAVVHHATGNVVFRDAANGTLLANVDVGSIPVDVEWSADGSSVGVAVRTGSRFVRLDGATFQVADTTVLSGTGPYQVQFTPDSTRAVIAFSGSGGASASVSVVDVASAVETLNFAIPDQSNLGFIQSPREPTLTLRRTPVRVTPDGQALIVSDLGDSRVRRYDLATGALTATSGFLGGVRLVSVSADGSRVLALDQQGQDFLHVLDGATLASLGSHPLLAASPMDLAITPDNLTGVVSMNAGARFVDLASGSVATVGDHAVGSALSADGSTLVSAQRNRVRVIDVASRSTLRVLPLRGSGPVALSANGDTAVVLDNDRSEQIHVIDVAGAASSSRWSAPTGPGLEGDGPLDVAITSDGALAVVAESQSNTVAIVDLEARMVRGSVPVADGPIRLTLDPSETLAYVVSKEGGVLSAIDLTTDALAWELFIGEALYDLELNADGDVLYLRHAQPVGTLTRVDVSGAVPVIEWALPVNIGYFYFPPFGDTKIRHGLALAPDGERLIAVHPSGWEVVDVVNAQVLFSGTVSTAYNPLEAWVAADGQSFYLATAAGAVEKRVLANSFMGPIWNHHQAGYSYGRFALAEEDGVAFTSSGMGNVNQVLRSIRTSTGAVEDFAGLGGGDPVGLERSGDSIFVATRQGELRRYSSNAGELALLQVIPLGINPVGLRFAAGAARAVAPTLDGEDALVLIEWGTGMPSTVCTQTTLNSTGALATTTLTGALFAASGDVQLVGAGLPPGQFGYFLASHSAGLVANPGGSQGNLCLGQPIARFASQVAQAGPTGGLVIELDMHALPFSPSVPVLPGDTLVFQAWYRDQNPTPTSNFTSAVEVTFP